MATETIDLRKELPVENGGHILYVFNEQKAYLENLMAYIMDGVKLGQNVFVIDQKEVYQEVQKAILVHLTKEEIESVYFEENGVFYAINEDFQCDKIVQHFEALLTAKSKPGRAIRAWSRVIWRDQQDINQRLEVSETQADEMIHESGILCVCAYDGSVIQGDLLIKMLKNHDYFMTDHELIQSQLYTRKEKKVAFPSLSVQSKIDSEIDFYKGKLDFVHVVSHEVRNPLTIINGYVNILRSTERNMSDEGAKKLVSIEQYVKVIDQELNHIIETEQMLSNELYMKLEVIHPYTILQEVMDLMSVKAFVQNVEFVSKVDLDKSHTMLGNKMGFRLLLSNLISNAIKYTEEEGQVSLSAEILNDRFRFVIKDNGIGMSQCQLKTLFKKYGKFNEGKSGQGIGLYIVKNLTDRFNGSIHFESEPGQGTVVTVVFPNHGDGSPAS